MPEREDLRVEKVLRTTRVRPLGPIRSFKREEYPSRQKGKQLQERSGEQKETEQWVNRAHHVPEKIGERIDFKI